MKIIKDNIAKISLRELGLGDDVDIRIWEALLPEIRKHLDGESSIFDCTESSNALLESAVIEPCLEEYWELNEKGAYTFKWTEKDDREFSDYIKARWSYMMWMAYEAMNGKLEEKLTFKSTLGTTWKKILDEAWERDFKIMHMLCGEITAQDVPAHVEDNDSCPELPF